MSKLTLPSGATVTLKDPNTLKVKDRNRIMKAGDGGSAAERGIAISNALLAILVEDWSFDLILPSVKVDSIEELTIPDYSALLKETETLIKELFPELNESVEAQLDPKAITENSKG
jgi:hypothetical protein